MLKFKYLSSVDTENRKCGTEIRSRVEIAIDSLNCFLGGGVQVFILFKAETYFK